MYGEFLLFHILIKNVCCGCLYYFIEFMSFFYSFIGYLSNSFILESSCIYNSSSNNYYYYTFKASKTKYQSGWLKQQKFISHKSGSFFFFFRCSVSVGQQVWFLLRPFPFPWKTATVLLSSPITFSLSTYNPGLSLSLSLSSYEHTSYIELGPHAWILL